MVVNVRFIFSKSKLWVEKISAKTSKSFLKLAECSAGISKSFLGLAECSDSISKSFLTLAEYSDGISKSFLVPSEPSDTLFVHLGLPPLASSDDPFVAGQAAQPVCRDPCGREHQYRADGDMEGDRDL